MNGQLLGSEFGPFNIPFPDAAADTVRPPGGMTPGRFEDRNKFYRKLLAASPVMEHGSDYQKESLLRSLENAHALADAIVAVLTVLGGAINLPHIASLHHWLEPLTTSAAVLTGAPEASTGLELGLMGLAVLIAAGGILLATRLLDPAALVPADRAPAAGRTKKPCSWRRTLP